MQVDDIYPSKWFRAADLKGQANQVTIRDVDCGEVGEKQQIILIFNGEWKPLGLNKTNAQAIADLYGSDTDDWIGASLVLFPTRVDFQGKMVDAVRVDTRATQRLLQEEVKKSKAASQTKPAKNQKPARPLTQEEVDAEEDIEIQTPF